MATKLDKLEQNLNYCFSDTALAQRALTHRSANKLNNERLEFLGDSLLGFVVAEFLWESYPQATEGELSRMRASMINKDNLATIAREIELGDHIQLGAGELKSGGKHRDSILADTVEAIIAAIYLDGGIDACKAFIRRWSTAKFSSDDSNQDQKDFKTRLQELMQARGQALPAYTVVEISGEAHQQTFRVECAIEDLQSPLQGSGTSKRSAEQNAAHNVLDILMEDS